MMNPKIILVLTILLAASGRSFAQDLKSFSKLDLTNKISPQTFSIDSNSPNKGDQKKPGEKSPYLAAAMSGLIPGAGELYAKSYLKAGIFFAVEATLWILYASYQKKGDDQTESFQNFADHNWDVYKYGRWLKEQSFPGADGIDLSADKETLRRQINVCEAQNFSHQLPPYGEQQYYELIGKYQNFVSGWADADLAVVNRNNYGSYKTTMYTNYSYDRQAANDYYDKGSTTLIGVVVNHLLSAADAAWSVSMFNKNIKVKTGFHLEDHYSYYGEKKLIPVGDFRFEF